MSFGLNPQNCRRQIHMACAALLETISTLFQMQLRYIPVHPVFTILQAVLVVRFLFVNLRAAGLVGDTAISYPHYLDNEIRDGAIDLKMRLQGKRESSKQ